MNPRDQQAQMAVQAAMQKHGVSPQTLGQIGAMAEATLKDKALYPMFRQQVITSGLADEKELPTAPDPFKIALIASAARRTGGAA